MSKAMKETSLSEENDPDALSNEISGRLLIDDDLVWVENTPCEVISFKNHLESSCEADTESVNIAQYEINTESRANTEECELESDSEKEHNITPSEWERGLSVEQQYWEQGTILRKRNGSKPKYPTSQRLTIKEYEKIDHSKRNNANPSNYKLNFPTTAVLQKLLEQKHAGPYHNVVGKGSNSVIIYAHYFEVPRIRGMSRMNSYYGVAVKVYKLSNDVDKNNAIFKRVQREYAHLKLLNYQGHIPYVIHRMKNVIITQFIGEDQETAPTISIVPSGYCRDLYQLIAKQMDKWYKMFNLVHGKLSTKNIVVQRHNNSFYSSRYKPYFLGWSHSVKTDHPQALVKLLRDCQFVTNFFKSREVPVKSVEDLFKDITGLDEISSKVVDALQKKSLWEEKQLTNPNRANQKGKSKKHETYR